MKEKVKIVEKLKINLTLLVLMFVCGVQPVHGLTFSMPRYGDVIGEMQTTTVRKGESLGELGRRFDVGVYEMIEANPNLDPWVPTVGAVAIVPTQFILPQGPRSGIVLNIAEMRLYYYHPDKKYVTTHPIGIGKKGGATPLGQTVITNKMKNPPWNPPDSIRKEHADKGDILPAVIPGGGPDNPLGLYAFYLSPNGLSIKGNFRIHGTNRAGGVGVRSSHGCIRLFPEDIESLFDLVPTGTLVRFVHEPYKAGWHKGHLYLEAHQPLTEPKYAGSNSLQRLEQVIRNAIEEGGYLINWDSAKMAAKKANGYPVRID